jgi:hypothetical protein
VTGEKAQKRNADKDAANRAEKLWNRNRALSSEGTNSDSMLGTSAQSVRSKIEKAAGSQEIAIKVEDNASWAIQTLVRSA